MAKKRSKSVEFKRARLQSLSADWITIVEHSRRRTNIPRSHQLNKNAELFEIEVELRPETKFCTGSYYTGEWNKFGMCGKGMYTLPNGVMYHGNIFNGAFHGKGKLVYPNGREIHCNWNHGLASNMHLIFPDELEYQKRCWFYCKSPDRRYNYCLLYGLRPITNHLITYNELSRKIPEGCYDTEEGFYNPTTKCLLDPRNPRNILRIPSECEEKWIIKHCRKAWVGQVGYKPNLIEKYLTPPESTSSLISSDSTITE